MYMVMMVRVQKGYVSQHSEAAKGGSNARSAGRAMEGRPNLIKSRGRVLIRGGLILQRNRADGDLLGQGKGSQQGGDGDGGFVPERAGDGDGDDDVG